MFSEAAIEVAKMVICYDLQVCGEFYARELTSGKRYEVVFVVKVEDTMSRFDILAKTQLMVPEKELQEQELQFVDLIKNEWIEIRVGAFVARPHKEKIAFYLYQDGSEQKMTGLLIKSAIIRLIN
ncbi:unnamed protein product [Arabis nemorensis]|uniref:Uncharacterized protein n=1 Tax=Arabis nemorensis TaxID=586526 RepID=A0A565C342_9BRAS|nr:unnamed protein product [Arabis nemorensis]